MQTAATTSRSAPTPGKSPALDSGLFRGLIETKIAETEARITGIKQKLADSKPIFGLTHLGDFNPPLNQADRWGLSNAQKILQRSREALERLNMGIYGFCFTCRQPIDSRRLQAVPHTRFCIRCKNGGTDN
jgi:hypothetical protein